MIRHTSSLTRTQRERLTRCDAGVVTFVSLVSPYAADRSRARTIHAEAGLSFLEVHVATSAGCCERRDPKGLYARARRGEIMGLTGVDAPYEPPTAPDIVVGGDGDSVAVSVDRMVAAIETYEGQARRRDAESVVAAHPFVSNCVSDGPNTADG